MKILEFAEQVTRILRCKCIHKKTLNDTALSDIMWRF